MPMPFLTADREPGPPDPHAHVPLPYLERDRWRRPYRPGPWRVAGNALLLLLSAYLLISALIIALAGRVAGTLVCLLCALVLVTAALRSLRLGIWVSSHGLRQVGLFTTSTLPWDDIVTVRTVQQPVKWLGLPRTVQGQILEVVRVKGEPLQTVLTDHSADFLDRGRAFDRAADVIESWAAESR